MDIVYHQRCRGLYRTSSCILTSASSSTKIKVIALVGINLMNGRGHLTSQVTKSGLPMCSIVLSIIASNENGKPAHTRICNLKGACARYLDLHVWSNPTTVVFHLLPNSDQTVQIRAHQVSPKTIEGFQVYK